MLQKQLKEVIEDYKPEILAFLSDIISYRSVLDKFDPDSKTPFGVANSEVLNHFLARAEKDGFTTKNVDNYAGHIEFGEGEKLFGLLCHLDVVPVNESEWKSDPFTLTDDGVNLTARGILDDKGPAVITYFALKILKDLGVKPNLRFRLILGCDEESGSRCLTHYFKKEELPSFGFSPDADFPLINGEKAFLTLNLKFKLPELITSFNCNYRPNMVPSKCSFTLAKNLDGEFKNFLSANSAISGEVVDGTYTIYGKTAHAATPSAGINALTYAFLFFASVTNSLFWSNLAKFHLDHNCANFGLTIENKELGIITQNPYCFNIDGNTVTLGVNYRIPVNNYKETLIAKYHSLFNNDLLDVSVLAEKNYHYVDPNLDHIKACLNAYREVSGDMDAMPFSIGGGTYAEFVPSCVAFGPHFKDDPDVCHIANEYVNKEKFFIALEIYLKALLNIIKDNATS